MKILLRIIAINYLITVIGTQLFIPSLITDPSKGMSLSNWLVYVWGVFFILGSLFFGVYMLYQWGVSSFSRPGLKALWFVVILIGIPLAYLGPIVYYIVVYELHKGGVIDRQEMMKCAQKSAGE